MIEQNSEAKTELETLDGDIRSFSIQRLIGALADRIAGSWPEGVR